MKMNMKWILVSLIIIPTFLFAKEISAQITLPRITTACETRSGHLYSFDDGFSRRKKCKGKSRRVVLIGEKGDKGDKGDTGPQGPQGPPGESGGDKSLKTYDNNGQFLGLYADESKFFHEPLNVIVHVDNGIIKPLIEPRFESSDCAGSGYTTNRDPALVNHLLSAGPRHHYIIERSSPEVNINGKSRLEYSYGTNSISCKEDISLYENVRLLEFVSVPFDTKIPSPLQYRYE